MEFFETLNTRHSIRSYSNKNVDPQKIQKILDFVCKAPSAGNLQGYKLFVVSSDPHRKLLVDCAQGQSFLAQAPCILVFCIDPDRSALKYHDRGRDLYCIQDATIACTYAMLGATALGLSSVWVGAFDETMVGKVLGIPSSLRPIILLPIGYPDQPARITTRRPMNEIVHFIE